MNPIPLPRWKGWWKTFGLEPGGDFPLLAAQK